MRDNFVMDNTSTNHDSHIHREQSPDDLTEIPGIGTAKQRWLQTKLGIYTFQDLAIASATEIEADLRADRCFISQREIEQWIAQAKERIANSPSLILPAPIAAPVPTNEWQTIASFTVQHQVRHVNGAIEQRTLTQHHETNQAVTWSLSPEPFQEVQQWMKLRIPAIDQISPEMKPSGNQAAIAAVIEGLQILQDTQSQPLFAWKQDNTQSLSLVRCGEPFILRTSFKFVGVPQGFVPARENYILQIYARHRALGTTLELGHLKAEIALNDPSSYVADLPDATLEQPGIYCVQVLVTLENLSVTPGYLEMPMLQVI